MDKTARPKFPKNWTYNFCTDGYVYTAPVGSFAANSFGLDDMHGNVWEWTEDCYHESYKGAPADGAPWKIGACKYRVLRGGAWIKGPRGLRFANRGSGKPGDHKDFLGFRVAKTITP